MPYSARPVDHDNAGGEGGDNTQPASLFDGETATTALE